MTDAPPVLPPADWYVDPSNAWQQRWWNGATWSEDIRPIPTQPAAPPAAAIDSAWHPVQSGGVAQAQVQANFSAAYEAPARPGRRGFFDSPFERPGTPRNIPGILSLTFALLCFILLGVSGITGIFIGLPLAIAAIVLALVGIVRAGRIGGRRGTSITGLVVGIIFLLATVIPFILVISASIERGSAAPSTSQIPDTSPATPIPARIPITTSAVLEQRVTVSVEGQLGESVTVNCPDQISTARGSLVACTGTYSDGATFDLDVTFLRDTGPYSWILTPTY